MVHTLAVRTFKQLVSGKMQLLVAENIGGIPIERQEQNAQNLISSNGNENASFLIINYVLFPVWECLG